MMASIDDGGPAFPVVHALVIPPTPPGQYSEVKSPPAQPGMSLRDWFAGQALPACMREAHDWFVAGGVGDVFQRAAYGAYRAADAMLKARGGA